MLTLKEQLEDIITWLYDIELASIDNELQRARYLLLDTLGCFIAAQSHIEIKSLIKEYTILDSGNIQLPGIAEGLSLSSASTLLTIGSCWNEACEGLSRSHGRPGLHAIPPALTIALANNLTLSKLLMAIISGYEIGARMGEVLRIREGMHVDGGWSSLAAAMSAARALSADQVCSLNAITIAASQLPFSLITPLATANTARNTYSAHSVQLGLFSAICANSGITAPVKAIEDYSTIALNQNETNITITKPNEFMINQGYIKFFPAVVHLHYAIEAALQYKKKYPLHSLITALTLLTYEEAIRYCFHRQPINMQQAQFSLSYAVAHTLVTGSFNMSSYTTASLKNNETKRLERLIKIEKKSNTHRSNKRGAQLIIHTSEQSHSCTINHIRGDGNSPLDIEQLKDKFLSNCAQAIPDNKHNKLMEGILYSPLTTLINDIFSS
ncbi:MmgE/PrpD family protein [Shewanella surugensis]|uniref:MmgE/PrpD family protein n=1 Tax=Shewanella surugensis TaxID=212020 RepID=A0ABT0LAN0_9GAMM|nr:MmgE/PrpD family protein [Shewanella surugensis]MCL1124732.1 MmgE/PrpD family protein [Shewanella surugensis]